MDGYDETLRNIYQDFAAFGSTRGASMPMMDGPKFAKFAKDCKLLDKTHLTSTDVDLIFAKAKSKTERRITYDQFQTAVSMMADKRFPDQAGVNALENLMKRVLASQGPKSSSVTVADSSGVYGKLTDASLYTGAHKERFNADGTGKGLEGRDRIAKGSGSSKGNIRVEIGSGEEDNYEEDDESTEALAGEVAKLGTKSPKASLSPTAAKSPKASQSPGKPALSKSGSSSAPKSPTAKASPTASPTSNSSMSKSGSLPLNKSPSSGGPAKQSIFDKLTDSSQYTGSHKNRFNADGSGKGLAGRDSVRKGGVSGQDLSQMLRK